MKHISAGLISILLFLSLAVSAQQIKKGEVTYKIEFEGLDELTSSYLQNSEMNLIFNKKNSKVTLDMAGLATNTTIIDLKKIKAVMLLDAMGEKMMFRMDESDLSKHWVEDYTMTRADESITIAGQECRVYKLETDVGTCEMCLTDAIDFDARYNTQFTKLKGFPLQYEYELNGMQMKLTATEVLSRKVKKKEFIIPTGYKESDMSTLEGIRDQNM